jgi:hypothetical protein
LPRRLAVFTAPASNALANDQSAIASISNANGTPPGVARRRQAVIANTTAKAASMMKATANGGNCQFIVFLRPRK